MVVDAEQKQRLSCLMCSPRNLQRAKIWYFKHLNAIYSTNYFRHAKTMLTEDILAPNAREYKSFDWLEQTENRNRGVWTIDLLREHTPQRTWQNFNANAITRSKYTTWTHLPQHARFCLSCSPNRQAQLQDSHSSRMVLLQPAPAGGPM